jgi:hypothetical protein
MWSVSGGCKGGGHGTVSHVGLCVGYSEDGLEMVG